MKNSTALKVKPFLRWAGGKNWLVKQIDQFIPEEFNNYHEPFLGGGSVFIHLKANKVITGKSYLSDLNKDLVNSYKIIKSHPSELVDELLKYENTEEFYYKIRSKKFDDKIKRAAQFIFLNKTSFNGIYRVNQLGQYNVPYGHRSVGQKVIKEEILELSKLFKSCFFSTKDFGKSIDFIEKGDLVFLDPPYTVAHENNGFVLYNQKIFSWEDQIRLKDYIEAVKAKGAYFILTNAAHKSIEELYKNTGTSLRLNRYSLIGGKGAARRKYNELLYKNI